MPSRTDIPHIYKPLLPLAWLYSAGVWMRNRLFDRGILPVEEFSVPVISVGNLTVGGTGKTPLIEYLIELLLPHKRIAVLSRGYRRKSKGWVIATSNSTASDIGDEPLQILRKYPTVTVAVDSNRRRGIRQLLQQHPQPEVILLDDAHQHRYVHPTLSIVLCDYNRPIHLISCCNNIKIFRILINHYLILQLIQPIKSSKRIISRKRFPAQRMK